MRGKKRGKKKSVHPGLDLFFPLQVRGLSWWDQVPEKGVGLFLNTCCYWISIFPLFFFFLLTFISSLISDLYWKALTNCKGFKILFITKTTMRKSMSTWAQDVNSECKQGRIIVRNNQAQVYSTICQRYPSTIFLLNKLVVHAYHEWAVHELPRV